MQRQKIRILKEHMTVEEVEARMTVEEVEANLDSMTWGPYTRYILTYADVC